MQQVREALTVGLAPNFSHQPSLHVAVSSLARPRAAPKPQAVLPKAVVETEKLITVFGMGEIEKPGKVQLHSGASLMQFLAQSGGTTPYAAIKRVQVRRTSASGGEITTYRINVKQMMNGKGGSFQMAPGDVVIVPERKLFE